MTLITTLEDERLFNSPKDVHTHDLYCDSLRAALTKKAAAEAQLCRTREALRSKVVDTLNAFLAPMEVCQAVVDSIDAALSSTSPCHHEAKVAMLEKAVDYVGNSLNWIESDDGYKMKRPGGGGRSGIMLISETVTPWAYINKIMGLRRAGGSDE